MLPGPGPVLCMIRERRVILKAVLHTRLAVQLQLAIYIIMLYYLTIFNVSLRNLAIVNLILQLLHCTYYYYYKYYDTMIIQVYYCLVFYYMYMH